MVDDEAGKPPLIRLDTRGYFRSAYNSRSSLYSVPGTFFSSYSVLVRKIILVLVLVLVHEKKHCILHDAFHSN